MQRFLRRRKSRGKIDWQDAPDIKTRVDFFVKELQFDWVQTENVQCFRSTNANTRAYARIWGLSRIWQQALGLQASYVIEVISEKFDRLSRTEQDKVLLHELAHIPKNFSGSLMPHTRRGSGSFHDKLDDMIDQYMKSKKLI